MLFSFLSLCDAQLQTMSDADLRKMLPNIAVIARALPTDKSRLVKVCQAVNKVVGMTGDGVNDSSALKKVRISFYHYCFFIYLLLILLH